MSTITTSKSEVTSPSVYVGTYEKYNNGSIKGAWLSLDGHDKESFYEACKELHADESDPEYMFQDFEGFPREFYGESGMEDDLWEWLALDEDDRKLWAIGIEAIGCSESFSNIQDAYAGQADSEADFAQTTAEEIGAIDDKLANWIVIDWEATWNCNLRHDYVSHYDSESGAYWFFRR